MATEREVIHSMYTKTTFVKIKQVLDIGKVLLSFVDTANKTNIDCYLSAEEYGALLMQDIKNGSIFRKLAEEKAKGEQYPKDIWQSPMGGSKKDGKVISRCFSIAPGSSAEVLFTAKQFPATETDTGAFVPIKGEKGTVIRVACTYNDLRLMQYKWSFLEQDYMTSRYNMSSMKSTYHNENKYKADDRSIEQNKNSTVKFLLKDTGRQVSNGMTVFTIMVENTLGRLYVRPEDMDKIPQNQNEINISCEKKGNDYLMIGA